MERKCYTSALYSLLILLSLAGCKKEESVQFSQLNYSASESDKYVEVLVERLGDVSNALTVDYSTTALSALAGSDFEPATGTISWLPNDSSPKAVRLDLLADLEAEPVESFEVSLSQPSYGKVGANQTATIDIEDSPCSNELNGTITEDTTLSEYCYHVTSALYVANQATLAIQPGVTLIFDSTTALNVKTDGALTGLGEPDDRIVLTGAVKERGYWAGLQFTYSDNNINRLDNVTIEYAGSAGSNGNSNLIMFGTVGLPQRLKASNLILRESSGYGFEFSNGATLDDFSNIISTGNTLGAGKITSNNAQKLDSFSRFSGNDIDLIYLSNYIVKEPQTWNKVDVPYFALQTINVEEELLISAGNTIIFAEDRYLNVKEPGALVAKGTPSEPIVFTGEEAVPGFWGGIQFTFSNNPKNEIKHAVVEYGGSGINNGDANIVMFGTDGLPQSLKISDTILRYSAGFGFEFNNGSNVLEFDNLTIHNNDLGPGFIPGNLLHVLDPDSDYSGNSVDLVVVKSDIVDVSQTWPDLNVDYQMLGGQSIENADLTIEGGSIFYFEEDRKIEVRNEASLNIEGTADNPVILTGNEAIPGYWQGIQFTFTNSINNAISHTTIEYAGGPGGNGEGAIVLFGNSPESRLEMTNSTVSHSAEYGVWGYTGSVFIESGNTYFDNALGDVFIQ